MQKSLESQKNELSKLGSRDPNRSELVADYNARVETFNALVAKTKKQIEDFNRQVAKFNRCITKFQD